MQKICARQTDALSVFVSQHGALPRLCVIDKKFREFVLMSKEKSFPLGPGNMTPYMKSKAWQVWLKILQ